MRNIKINFLLALLPNVLTYFSNAQGCSDAGFCTLNSFKPNTSDSVVKLKNQFRAGVSFGSADNSILILSNYFEYNRKLNEKLSIDAKLTTIYQSGNGISEFGLSDIYINANFNISKKVKLTAGAKTPLTNGNRTKNHFPLPMDYQASLGTFDLILGIGYQIRKLQFVLALQQPLNQNSNEFIAENYPINSKLRVFQSTNKFKRSGDILFRVSYPIRLKEKLNLTPGILPIFHLANDKFSDQLNIEKEISGSQGLTLNGNIYLDYEINRKNIIQLSFGVPFIVRDARPDGLTRHFVINLEYGLKF